MAYRKHYKCVGEKGVTRRVAERMWPHITAQAIVEHQDREAEEFLEDPLSAEDLAVWKFKITHGLKNDHPLNHVRFFDHRSQNQECFKLQKHVLDGMLPKENQTWIVRCFVKPIDRMKYVQAEVAFKSYCESNLGGESREVIKS